MIKIANKRKFYRSECHVPVEGREGGIFDETQTLDVSKRGLGFLSTHDIPVGNKISVELDFEEQGDPILVVGEVVWSQKVPSDEGYRVGMKFVEILHGSKVRLDKQFTRQSVKKWL